MNIHKVRESLQVQDSNIGGSHFLNVGAAACIFDDVNLQGATFSNINLSQAQYSNVNLSNVSIKDANLTGMKINDVLITDLFDAYRTKKRNPISAVLFAKNVLYMQRFYQNVLKLNVEDAQNDYAILASPALRLIIHAIPGHLKSSVNMESPPRLRQESAVKLVFEVNNIAEIRSIAQVHGGEVFSSEREWIFQKRRVCDGHDPEGNVVQFQQRL